VCETDRLAVVVAAVLGLLVVLASQPPEPPADWLLIFKPQQKNLTPKERKKTQKKRNGKNIKIQLIKM